MLYRRYKQEQTGDCGVVSGENLGRQHRVVVCRMKSDIKAKIETRITGKEQLEWEKKRLRPEEKARRGGGMLWISGLKTEDMCVKERETGGKEIIQEK